MNQTKQQNKQPNSRILAPKKAGKPTKNSKNTCELESSRASKQTNWKNEHGHESNITIKQISRTLATKEARKHPSKKQHSKYEGKSPDKPIARTCVIKKAGMQASKLQEWKELWKGKAKSDNVSKFERKKQADKLQETL